LRRKKRGFSKQPSLDRHSGGLEAHMFSRQASLFVGYLKKQSEIRFGLFMLAIAIIAISRK
jgi:hypothetical protein